MFRAKAKEERDESPTRPEERKYEGSHINIAVGADTECIHKAQSTNGY